MSVIHNRLKTLAELHAEWWEAVGPPDSSRVQFVGMRRSFYAGFFEALCSVREVSSNNSQDVACDYFQALTVEARAFFDLARLEMEQVDHAAPPAEM